MTILLFAYGIEETKTKSSELCRTMQTLTTRHPLKSNHASITYSDSDKCNQLAHFCTYPGDIIDKAARAGIKIQCNIPQFAPQPKPTFVHAGEAVLEHGEFVDLSEFLEERSEVLLVQIARYLPDE